MRLITEICRLTRATNLSLDMVVKQLISVYSYMLSKMQVKIA